MEKPQTLSSCGKEMGYKHESGVKAYCGDDVGTHIIYCKRCEKINTQMQKHFGDKLTGKPVDLS